MQTQRRKASVSLSSKACTPLSLKENEGNMFTTQLSNSINAQPIPPTLDKIQTKLNHLKRKALGHDALSIDDFRKSFDVSIPYSELQLRQAANRSINFSTTHAKRNRSEFYTADPNYKSHKAPLLMDGFSYCEGSNLMVEVLFNLKYMYDEVDREIVIASMKDTWICIHHGITVQSEYPLDPHKHVIITVFNFTNQCSTADDHHYEIRAVEGKYNYSLNLEFLPYFQTQRFYISMCIFIKKAPEKQVIAFINHYFFHGIQHFVFNINGNLEYWSKVLKRYSDHGIVDVVDFEYPSLKGFYEQQVVMNSCNRRFRYATQFMIQCDVDEFFLPLNPKWRIVDVVRLYDSVYPEMDAFSVIDENNADE